MTTSNLPALPENQKEWEQALITAGFITPNMGGSTQNRLRVNGNNILLGEDIIASYNAKTKEPALIVQLMDTPEQYQSMWFDKDGNLARFVGRPEMAGKFCRSYFDNPNQARKHAEDGTSCEACPVHPFVPRDSLPAEALNQDGANKCSWRGDVEFRILNKNEDGTLSAEDETIYTMSLPTTAMIEFLGSNSKTANKMAGSVSDQNFMVKLASLGLQKWGNEGLSKALTYLRLGGVIAEIRILPASNKEKNYNYNVTSFTPIDILEITEQPALETADESIPF